jgi:hypothetical protein
MSRIILSVLRQATEPLTTRDIALQLLIERALDKSDLRLRLMTKGSESRSGASGEMGWSGAIRGLGSIRSAALSRPPAAFPAGSPEFFNGLLSICEVLHTGPLESSL